MRLAGTPRWLILLVVALAARAITFGNPILHVDEEFYFTAARMMLDGAIPFVDVWDRKPIGLFLLYAPAAALGYPLGIWAYQALALACLWGTALIAMRLAERAGWTKGALATGIVVILWSNLLDGQGGQAPVFFNLLMVAAALLAAPHDDDLASTRRCRRWIAAMALVGIALQIKYSVVVEGIFLGLWMLAVEWRIRRKARTLVALAAGLVTVALLPTAAAWTWYAAHGHGDAWLYANFLSIFDRASDPWSERLGHIAGLVAILSPLFAAAAISWRERPPTTMPRSTIHFLFLWLAAAVLGLQIFGSYLEHYALPLIVPVAICAAGAFGSRPRIALGLLIVAFLGGQALLLAKLAGRGTPAQVAAVANTIGQGQGGQGPGCLFVYSGSTMLYTMTHRCRVTPWIFPSHIARIREQGATGTSQDDELGRVMARAPQWVVMRKAYRGERPELRARMLDHLQRGYRLVTIMPMGNENYMLWRRISP